VACTAESAIESDVAASLIKLLNCESDLPHRELLLHLNSSNPNLFVIWMSRQMTGEMAVQMIWPNEI